MWDTVAPVFDRDLASNAEMMHFERSPETTSALLGLGTLRLAAFFLKAPIPAGPNTNRLTRSFPCFTNGGTCGTIIALAGTKLAAGKCSPPLKSGRSCVVTTDDV